MEKSTQVSDEGNNSSQDRISALPDEILLHILSLLPPGEAVKTGALSKRWEYLWTSVPNLSFSCHCLEPESVSFVNQSLLFHKRRNVTKFRVTTPYDETIASDVDNWVRFVMRANVEELCLDLDGGDVDYDFYYELPHLLYTNSSIMKLTLICCNVEPNGLIKWKSLKSLLIGFVKLSEDVIQKILVGSPVLEFLDLCGFDGFYRLDIGSASLRKLVVRDHWPVEDEVDGSNLEISAPNLQSLSILGEMFHMKVRLVNVQSLDDCNLNFQLDTDDEDKNNDYEVHRNMLRELLVSLSNVKQLTLGNWCIQVLSMLELKDTLFPLAKCKCLILDTPIKKCDVPGIAGLLHSSPSLETLIIKISMISLYNSSSIFHSENDFGGKFLENYLTSEKGRSKCLPLQLKTVKIVGFMESELVIPLVQFLLEMAKVLEKIYIDVEGDLSDKLLELAQKLQNLPRISPHAEVLFLNARENS